jgi:hypothetical protein
MSMFIVAMMAAGCAQVARAPIVVGFAPAVARRGAEVALDVRYIDGPAGLQPVPPECLAGWRVSGTGVSFDRRSVHVRIGTEAVVGEQASVSVVAGGKRVERVFIVRGEDEVVIAGRWVHTAGSCHLFPYVELVFSDDGKLTYTSPERMMESKSDGTLPYEWHADQGVVSSTLFQGGGATAIVKDREMQLQPAPGCNLRFERR